jgi:hypothetical protein
MYRNESLASKIGPYTDLNYTQFGYSQWHEKSDLAVRGAAPQKKSGVLRRIAISKNNEAFLSEFACLLTTRFLQRV